MKKFNDDGIEHNFSEIISNFNYCDNPFISNGTNGYRINIRNQLLNRNINENEKIEKKFELYINGLTKNDDLQDNKSSNNNCSMKNYKRFNMEKEKNADRNIAIKIIQQMPEYKFYNEKKQKINNKINVISSVIFIYTFLMINNAYENYYHTRAYDKLEEIINLQKKPIINERVLVFSFKNFKMHCMIILPCSLGLLFYTRKSRQIKHTIDNFIEESLND